MSGRMRRKKCKTDLTTVDEDSHEEKERVDASVDDRKDLKKESSSASSTATNTTITTDVFKLLPIKSDAGDFFSLEEKSKFLMVVKTKGFNVIYTPEKLLEDFPGKTVAEISRFIEKYKIKGHRHGLKRRTGSDQSQHRTSLEQWFKLVHASMKPQAKKDDLSRGLIDAMRHLADDSSEKYSNVYAYISDCLEGKYPRELEGEDILVMVSLLEDLNAYITKHGFADVKTFLSNLKLGSSSLPPPEPSVESASQGNALIVSDSVSSGQPTDENVNRQSRQGRNSSETFSHPSPESAKGLMRKYIEESRSLPKLRKVKECLNPLNVPVSLLRQQTEQLNEANV